MDLGSGINGYAKTAHGGFYGVVLDEVMGTAANLQAGMLFSPSIFLHTLSLYADNPKSTRSIHSLSNRKFQKTLIYPQYRRSTRPSG